MNFEENRSYITHTLLANGFFYYLCAPADLWKTALTLEESKIDLLCRSWKAATKKPALVRHAVGTWRGNNQEQGIYEAVRELYHQCWRGKHFRPRSSFPHIDEVELWLKEMEAFIELITPISNSEINVSMIDIKTFWISGLSLFNFLQGIGINNPRFSDFFERIK